MRALSASQAGRCEKAKGGKCRCRCGGAFHGINVGGGRPPPWELPKDDPHHTRQPAEKSRERRLRAKRTPQLEPDWQP